MQPLTYLDKPFETQDRPMPHHLCGLSWTATGYGGKIPSTRMIRIEGEKVWRRVYVMVYSNSGTAYVVIKGQNHVIRDSDF
jgi:hypothetical protein